MTLNEKREVVQLAPMQSLGFGERDGRTSDRVKAIAEVFARGNCGAAPSEHVMQDMWEKWVFLASLAASTCLMRTSVGNIMAVTGGKEFLLGMLDECTAVATAEGFAPARAVLPAHPRHPDHGGLADDRLDVPRRQGRRCRSRPITSSAISLRAPMRQKFRCQSCARPIHI